MKQELIDLVKEVPYGHVVAYGTLATMLDIRYEIKTS